MIQLGEHFGDDIRRDNSENARRRKWFLKSRQDKARQMELADDAVDSNLMTAVSIVIATEAQIDVFSYKLERYDAAVTEALWENEEQLQLIRERILEAEQRLQSMLDEAHVLEDGRRVFKSEDGSYVIDEDGNNVSPDEVDFDTITGPTAEAYQQQDKMLKDALEQEARLLEERQRLHDAQDVIREKQEALEAGKTTAQELEEFDKEVFDALPPSARAKLPDDLNPVANAPDLKSNFQIPASAVPSIPVSTPSQHFGLDS